MQLRIKNSVGFSFLPNCMLSVGVFTATLTSFLSFSLFIFHSFDSTFVFTILTPSYSTLLYLFTRSSTSSMYSLSSSLGFHGTLSHNPFLLLTFSLWG